VAFAAAVALALDGESRAEAFEHPALERLTNAPKQVVRNRIDARPKLLGRQMRAPLPAENRVEDVDPLARQKRRDVNPVRDVRNGIFLRWDLGPERREKPRGDAAVNPAYAIVQARPANGERG